MINITKKITHSVDVVIARDMPESTGIEVKNVKSGSTTRRYSAARGHPGSWIDEREIDVPVQVHK